MLAVRDPLLTQVEVLRPLYGPVEVRCLSGAECVHSFATDRRGAGRLLSWLESHDRPALSELLEMLG